jgi:hypothetical protein
VEPVDIEAPVIQLDGANIEAEGGVRFTSGEKRMTAREVTYDTAKRTGTMLNARFTTCTEEKPHYFVSARQIVLGPENRLCTRGASLTVLGVKLITLPSLRFRLGSRTAETKLPNPGYDRRDGFTLGQGFRLLETPRSSALASAKLTARHGYQFEMNGQYGVDGLLAMPEGRLMRYDALANEVTDAAEKHGPLNHPTTPDASRLTAFGSVSLRSRAFDLMDTSLVYYKRPEVGLNYLPRGINISGGSIDQRLRLLPEVTATWGRYAEIPNPYGTVGRTGISVSLPAHKLRSSFTSALQPVLTYSWAHYSIGSTYRIWGWGLDYSKLHSNGSFFTARYFQREDSGLTPFEFDDLDITRQLDIGTQIKHGRHTYGFVGSWDVKVPTLEDWTVLYGYSLDCLTGTITWNGRYKRLGFGIDLAGL